MPDSINRINKLENIYIKNGIAGQRLGMTNPNINLTSKVIPSQAIPITDEYI